MKVPSAMGTKPSVRMLIASPNAQAPAMWVMALAGPWAMQMRPHEMLSTAIDEPVTKAPAIASAVIWALAARRMDAVEIAPATAATKVVLTLHIDEVCRLAATASARNTMALAVSMTMNDSWANSGACARSSPFRSASTKYRESPNIARSIQVQKKLAPTIASQEEEPLRALKFITPFPQRRSIEPQHHIMMRDRRFPKL